MLAWEVMRIDGCQRMAIDTDVVIVGAGCLPGPMGSSIEFFGEPMKPWLTQMPEGMPLKSEGFASNLYAPDSGYALGEYCEENGHAYEHIGLLAV